MKQCSRKEIWGAMDGDTQDFVRALTASFEMTQIVDLKVKDRPQPVKVAEKIKTRLTIKSITLEKKQLIYEKSS